MTTISAENQIYLEKSRRLYGFYISWVADRFEDTIHAPHIQKLSKRLEDLERPDTKNRLCVAMPPQHSKSSLVTVAYPAWSICRNQNLRILIVNAEKELSTSFGIQIRNLLYNIKDYIDFNISDVKSSSTHLMFEKDGELCSGEIRLTGAGGSITGHAVDILIIDDPYKGREDEFTPTQLQKKWNWFTTLIEQRLRPGGILIILHTRWHSEDIQGRILADDYQKSKYTFLELPAIAGANDMLGREPGAPLWPGYYDLEFYRDKQRTMGERQFQAIYQQKPLDLTSNFFHTNRLIFENYFDDYPIARCRSWDMASSDETFGDERDYTVGARMLKTPGDQYWIFDYERGQYGNNVKNIIKNIAVTDTPAYHILLEPGTKGGAAKLLYNEYAAYLTGYPTTQSEPIGTKADRATPLANAIYDRKVHVMINDNEKRELLLSELRAFPNGKHDDIVDALAYGYLWLKNHGESVVRTASKRKRESL